MMLLHLGYFNNVEDLKIFSNSPSEEIVFNALYSIKGHFYKVDTEVYDIRDIEHLNPQFTDDKEYAVVYDIPTDKSMLENICKDDYCDYFIDVYKVIDNNEMVRIDKVCEWLKSKDDLCCGELSMILGTNFIENFKKEMTIKQ